MRHFLIAFQFLTIIPVPVRLRYEQDDLGRSTAWFPLVGLTIGGLLVLADLTLTPLFPRHLVDALLITLLAFVTGALHLDGLADVCDGLAARGSKERFLSIMKDSRVGAVGGAGLALGILLKYSALLAVPIYLKRPALLIVPAMARFCQITLLYNSRSARSDGLGACFLNSMQPIHFAAAAACMLPMAWFGLQIAGLAALAILFIWTLLIRRYFTRRLGGVTGDIAGFTSETAEILALLVITAAVSIQTRL